MDTKEKIIYGGLAAFAVGIVFIFFALATAAIAIWRAF